MKTPKFDIGDKVANIKDIYNRNRGWRCNNAPKGSLFTVRKIIIESNQISYELWNWQYCSFTAKEEELISEKDFIKELKEKFKK